MSSVDLKNIDIDADAVDRSAKQLKSIAETLSQQTACISAMSEKLEAAMINQHMGIYNSISECLKNDIKNTSNKIKNISDYLTRSANAVRKAENDIKKSMFNN